jgi:hypothetical protein
MDKIDLHAGQVWVVTENKWDGDHWVPTIIERRVIRATWAREIEFSTGGGTYWCTRRRFEIWIKQTGAVLE